MSEINKKVAVKIDSVSKTFKLPHEKHTSLKGVLVNLFRHNSTYEKQEVLNDISFEIKSGEFFGIVGRNGSGKSTLLKIMAGIYKPNNGSVHINGSLTPFIELGVGFNPELTGKENVFLNGALLGFSRAEMDEKYDEIVEFAELERFMDQKLKNYSSGMQVRLAFSIAIQADSDILLLDEVLAVGDANFQKKCYDYFQDLKDNKKTVILVSHDMESVKRFADRAIMLEDGEIVANGSPESVSDKYTLSNIERLRERDEVKKVQKIIKKVYFTNQDNKVVKNTDTGKSVDINVEYDASSVEGEVNFGVGMHLSTGGYVFSYNTKMDKHKILNKKGKITLNLDNLPLLKGDYFVNVVCFGNNEAVPSEFISKAAYIFVSPTGRPGSYRGIVNIKHNWR